MINFIKKFKIWLVGLFIIPIAFAATSIDIEKEVTTIDEKIEKEEIVISLDQKIKEEEHGRYKYKSKYSKNGIQYSIDDIVVWDGDTFPKNIGYKITMIDENNNKKTILKMDNEKTVESEWINIPIIYTLTATSTNEKNN